MATSLQTMQKGKFPSCPKINPREECKAVTLRSGKKLSTPLINDEDDELPQEEDKAIIEDIQQKESASKEKEKSKSNIGSTSNSTSFIPNTLPFPQRFQKKKIDAQFSKFLDIFKKLEINLPFAEALEQMPKYAKFIKDVLSKKKRYGDYEVVALTEECSTTLQRKLPPKLKDPGSFSIPCHLGNNKVTKALCDLGASINLMPLSMFRKLNGGEVQPTTISLLLADRSFVHPYGIVEDVLVKVDKFIFPKDFVILDMEEDAEVPIILGRPFLATGRALIDVQDGKLTFRLNDEEVTFDIYKTLKHPDVERYEHHEPSTKVTSPLSSNKNSMHDEPPLNGKTNDMLDVKVENSMKHVSSCDISPSSSYMPPKPIMNYEQIMEKHDKNEVVSPLKSKHDDSLISLDHIRNDDVQLDNDLLTNSLNANEYVCECQCGRILKVVGDPKHERKKPPWDPP